MATFIATKDNISIYIHWPFCKAKCPYCDFNSHVSSDINHDAWKKAYITAIKHYSSVLENRKVQSIYFGGGTPSLMEPSTTEAIISEIAKASQFADDIEITMEANPTSIEANKLRDFHQAGINRISIGIQSLSQNYLKFLGREHSADEAIRALNIAREIFDRYTFDLIYALPEQTLEQWEAQLKDAMQLAGVHISLYQLTIEKGTPFFAQHKRGEFALPSQELAAAMYDATSDILEDYGYSAYEVSNYAKKGHESRHNLAYWRYEDYLGIGPGAHGRLTKQGVKHAMQDYYNPSIWLEKVAESGHGSQIYDPLSEADVAKEALIMGLRLKCGVELSRLDNAKALALCENGLAAIENERFALTKQGVLVLNSVLEYLC